MSRLLVTTVFGAAALGVAVSALNAVDVALGTGTAASWAVAAFELLRFGVIQAFTILVAKRGESIRPSREPIAFVACAAAFVSIAVLRRPSASGGSGLIITGDVVAAVFEAWLLVSVLALGRCFGILPEARGMVTRGPYRLVRHPVYLGELGAVAGFLIAAPSWWNLFAGASAIAAQLVRIRLEEQELSANFPIYREYVARTPMLVPVARRRGRKRALTPVEPRVALALSASESRRNSNS